MRPLGYGLLAAALLLALSASGWAATVQVEPKPLALGQPALVRACLARGVQQARAEFLGRSTALSQGRDGCWYGAVAADLQAPLGRPVLRIKADGRQVAAARIRLFRADRGLRRITVDPKYLKLTPEALARYKREKALLQEAFNTFTPRRLWHGAFQRPLSGKLISAFGRRSVINGQERSPHGGVDLRGARGTPVRAAAAGRVVLVLDTYFGGLSILLDHGQGLLSRYLHLSAAQVKQGQMVQKGQIIGKVGASGRVTGPHLDFGIKLAGARVDPLAWIEVSRRLSRRLGD